MEHINVFQNNMAKLSEFVLMTFSLFVWIYMQQFVHFCQKFTQRTFFYHTKN